MHTAFHAPVAKAAHRGPAETTILLTVNGDDHHLKVDPATTLVDLLRDDLHLTGTERGCNHDRCRACLVLVDGHRARACRTLATTLDGARVTTVEGLKRDGRLDELLRGMTTGIATPVGSTPAAVPTAQARPRR